MKRLLIYMVCVWLSGGCSPEDGRFSPSSGAIRFVSGISVEQTRVGGAVAGTMLPVGSRIGLCARSQGVEAVAEGTAEAAMIVMANLPGTIGAEGAIDYNPVKYYEAGKKYAFYACYPYTETLAYADASQTPSLPVNLATHADVQEDYMWAALSDVTYTSGSYSAQKFTFRHALCRIRIRIWNGSGGEVSLGGILLKAPGNGVLSLADGSWAETGDANEAAGTDFISFTLFHPAEPVKLATDDFYEVPASLLQLPVGEERMKLQTFSVLIGGKTYEIPPATPSGGWQSGVSYLYTVWYDTGGIGFKGTIEPWGTVDGGNVDTEE